MTFAVPVATLAAILLAALRTGVLLFLLPTSGEGGSPLPRVILSLLLGCVFAPLVEVELPESLLALAGFAGRELLIGAALGLLCRILLLAPLVGGDLVAQDAGLRLAQEVDPFTRIPSTALGRIFEVTVLLMFLALQGPQEVLRALSRSFETFPPGRPGLPDGLPALLAAVRDLMQQAVQIAAPMMAVLFLASVMLALLAKAVPQLQVLNFGYPLRLAGTLLLLGYFFPLVYQRGTGLLEAVRRSLYGLVHSGGA